MKLQYFVKSILGVLLFTLVILPLSIGSAVAAGVENSYHAQLGYNTGEGMLQKWCALPNFSFEQDGGIDSWVKKPCTECHIGSAWNPKGAYSGVDCTYCHDSADPQRNDVSVTPEKCLGCHYKDTMKRGDAFTAEEDVHAALGMVCQDCHLKDNVNGSDHQFWKGSIIDTTERTLKGKLSCVSGGCHSETPHNPKKQGGKLNDHVAKVACETCHTGLRPAAAMASRTWSVFNEDGSPVTTKKAAGWLPVHKWYDDSIFLLPIVGYTDLRDLPNAKITAFNTVAATWFVKSPESEFDDVIPVRDVKAADVDPKDGTVTLEEMQALYPDATLVTEDMNFNITHSVVPKKLAFDCKDCHGRNGWVLNWTQLGYEKDPRGKGKGGGKKPN